MTAAKHLLSIILCTAFLFSGNLSFAYDKSRIPNLTSNWPDHIQMPHDLVDGFFLPFRIYAKKLLQSRVVHFVGDKKVIIYEEPFSKNRENPFTMVLNPVPIANGFKYLMRISRNHAPQGRIEILCQGTNLTSWPIEKAAKFIFPKWYDCKHYEIIANENSFWLKVNTTPERIDGEVYTENGRVSFEIHHEEDKDSVIFRSRWRSVKIFRRLVSERAYEFQEYVWNYSDAQSPVTVLKKLTDMGLGSKLFQYSTKMVQDIQNNGSWPKVK